MTEYKAPSKTNYTCIVGWLRGKYEDGYVYSVWDGDEWIGGGGLGHKPYRWRCDPDEETNLPTIADLIMDSWGAIHWESHEGRLLIRLLIDDAWNEAIPDDEYGPPPRIRKLIGEVLDGTAGAAQQRSRTA